MDQDLSAAEPPWEDDPEQWYFSNLVEHEQPSRVSDQTETGIFVRSGKPGNGQTRNIHEGESDLCDT